MEVSIHDVTEYCQVQWSLGLGPYSWICMCAQQPGNTLLQCLLHLLMFTAQMATGGQAVGCVCRSVKGKYVFVFLHAHSLHVLFLFLRIIYSLKCFEGGSERMSQ